jgi:hypothetical protein
VVGPSHSVASMSSSATQPPSPPNKPPGKRPGTRRGFTQLCKRDDDVHAYGTLPIRESVVTPDVRVYHAPGDGATLASKKEGRYARKVAPKLWNRRRRVRSQYRACDTKGTSNSRSRGTLAAPTASLRQLVWGSRRSKNRQRVETLVTDWLVTEKN